MIVMPNSLCMFLDARIPFCRFRVNLLSLWMLTVTCMLVCIGFVNNSALLLYHAGKVNNITVDKCTKMGVLFKVCRRRLTFYIYIFRSIIFTHYAAFDLNWQDVVAAFEIVNCNGVEAQCQVSSSSLMLVLLLWYIN